MSNQNQDEPPLVNPDKIMFWLILSMIIFIISFILIIRTAKVDNINFQFERVQDGIPLHITEEGLIAQAPPYLLSEHKVLATLSAYNPVEEQCDSTPDITASGRKVREGYVANNCLPFGTMVKIKGRYYEVQDRMNARYSCEYFDILMWDYHEAITFGRQVKEITYYKLVR